MEQRRQFRVFAVKSKSSNEFGIGIEERSGHEVLAIASLYLENCNNKGRANKHALMYILKLVGDDPAIVRIPHGFKYRTPPNVKVRSLEPCLNLTDCKLLALDGLNRKEDIYEKLN